MVAQADAQFRAQKEDVLKLKTRNEKGEMVPLGALVTIDDVPVGTTPLSRPVKPGKHKVHVAQAGYADAAPVWVEVPPNGAVEHRPRLYEIPARDRPNRSASEGTGTNVQIVK